MFRYLMIAGAMLTAVALAYRLLGSNLQDPDATRHREILDQMMEHNRRAFPEVDVIDVAKVIPLMKQNDLVIVDVRSDAERKVSIIPGAVSAAEFERNIGKHVGKSVVCYCTIGYRSAEYAQSMKRRGIQITSFNGSIIAWCQAGQNLTTADGRETKQVHIYGP